MTLLTLCVALTTSVTLTGNYVKIRWVESGPKLYTFQVGGVVVSQSNDYTVGISKVSAFPGTNVQCLMMDFNNLKYLPANYTRFFPVVQYLIVKNSHVKYVTNADFLGLKYVTHIDFQYNEIEHLPNNLFEGVSRELSTISFADNKITHVGTNIITNIPSLSSLIMTSNPCINLKSPVPFKTFTTTFRTKCQQPIASDVDTDLSQYSEDSNISNVTTVNLMIKNTNLTAEVTLLLKTNNDLNKGIEETNKLSLDLNKCKMSSVKLQTQLTNFRSKTQ